VEAALKYADRRKDKMEITGAFCDHWNAPKNVYTAPLLLVAKHYINQKISTHSPLLVGKVPKNKGLQ